MLFFVPTKCAARKIMLVKNCLIIAFLESSITRIWNFDNYFHFFFSGFWKDDVMVDGKYVFDDGLKYKHTGKKKRRERE